MFLVFLGFSNFHLTALLVVFDVKHINQLTAACTQSKHSLLAL
jgi:hypothetical protein